jgi:2-hydroxychromene-2-carboxylate isomerase
MPKTRIEFFFDYSSPWTFLAFDRIERICALLDAELVWKPFLVGGVFNTINPSVYQRRENPIPSKDRYYQKDMHDWAKLQGITLGKPSVFPVNSVKALRGAFLAIDQGKISPYSRAMFEAYWSELRDISQDDVLADVVAKAGMERDAFFAGIARQDIKDRLRANTDELIARGGFGSPTMFVDGDDMYFGNDRIELMQALVERSRAGR